jgi:NADH-quinone oxidoreductase subunit J
MHIVVNAQTITFYIISLVILACAMMLLSFRKVIYMALAIGGVFIGCAAIYMLLGAEFVGIAQILIYAGAITILMMFAIMLTNHQATEPEMKWTPRNVVSLIGAILLGGLLLLALRFTTWTAMDGSADVNAGLANPVAIGVTLFKTYTIPFELVSLLLIVGLVGAVVLAHERKEED